MTAQSINPSVIYTGLITGAPDSLPDFDLKFSSFQARRVSGRPSYLSMVIPNGFDSITEISNRPNGELVINMLVSESGVLNSYEIMRANYETLRGDQGSEKYSLTLTGHKQVTYSTPKTVTLEGSTYRSTVDGKIRHRSVPDKELNPLDTANINGESFVVGEIVLAVGASFQTMEIVENG